jgi:large subunit ribosomal protein L25
MQVALRTEAPAVVRDNGMVPGVIYGHNIKPKKIQVDHKELIQEYLKNGNSMSFGVKLQNRDHTVFIKEIQKDPINRNIIHFDLMKVAATDIMTASIPVHLNGREKVEKKGVVVQLLSDTVDYEFPVNKGISHLDIDVSHLEVGDSILAKAIDVPEGFLLHEDPDKIIVNVTHAAYVDNDATINEEENKEPDAEVPTMQ